MFGLPAYTDSRLDRYRKDGCSESDEGLWSGRDYELIIQSSRNPSKVKL